MERINIMSKHFIYRLKRKLGISKPNEYLEYLRALGVSIGQGTVVFSNNVTIDAQRPWMIEIGNYCKITDGVIILQHDYSRSVLRRVYGDIVGESKKTIIGDNVFLGVNSVILMGSKIGNNVIVGAGSVVSGKIPDNVVVAGNPARVVRTLEEHYKIRKEKTKNEAKNTAIEFYNKYGRNPSEAEMGSFWQLFMPHDKQLLCEKNIFTKLSGDSEEEIISDWLEGEAIYESYDDFLRSCGLL